MNWKEQFERYEYNKDWNAAIALVGNIIKEHPGDVESYIRVIYLLHHILVEEEYSDTEHDQMSGLLKQYFNESHKLFSNNEEYLFFIGKILYIAEWYFGIDDDLKPLSKKLAFQMQKKAYERHHENTLFEWAYRFSLNDDIAGYLADQILSHDHAKIEWLKSKGFPGKYILDCLEQSRSKYLESTKHIR